MPKKYHSYQNSKHLCLFLWQTLMISFIFVHCYFSFVFWSFWVVQIKIKKKRENLCTKTARANKHKQDKYHAVETIKHSKSDKSSNNNNLIASCWRDNWWSFEVEPCVLVQIRTWNNKMLQNKFEFACKND